MRRNKNKKDRGSIESISIGGHTFPVADRQPALVEKQAPEEDERGAWPVNGYKIADDHSVCCGDKVLKPGDPIEPSDIHKDEKLAWEMFDRLLNTGHIDEA